MKSRPVIGFVAILAVIVCATIFVAARIVQARNPPRQLTPRELTDKALIDAVHAGSKARVQGALDAGADPNARGYWDERGFWDAKRYMRVWEPRTNREGPTALMLAAFTGNLDNAKLLLSQGADLNARDIEGNTALMYAGLYGRNDISHLLLDHGADVKPSRHGEDPLGYAVASGDDKLVRRLIARGARVNSLDAFGNIPLHRACGISSSRVIRILLEHGASSNVVDSDGNTPLHTVIDSGSSSHGFRIDPKERIASVRALLERHPRLGIADRQGRTPLQVAKQHGLTEIITLLTKAGATK